MDITSILSTTMTVVGVLVVLTNIMTQVLKGLLYDLVPPNLLAVIIAEVLSMVGLFAALHITNTAFVWYMIPGAIVVGFLIAYAAMFGFDKLREMLSQVNK